MSENTKTVAKVQVFLEVELPNRWSSESDLAQVYKQAKDSARNIISQAIISSRKNIKIAGLKVTIVMIEE